MIGDLSPDGIIADIFTKRPSGKDGLCPKTKLEELSLG